MVRDQARYPRQSRLSTTLHCRKDFTCCVIDFSAKCEPDTDRQAPFPSMIPKSVIKEQAGIVKVESEKIGSLSRLPIYE